ncbi:MULTISPECIES: AglZ/HisF2 family acetamidino modification protein [unclassified Cupriavidus]|uniref:AglZ/HisF2 family acetamidino modification protein n=1 Tax=unclassified Cupriavidus TaxID=2640874 RepID=UPI0010F6B18A|nr:MULTISPECIES: AglZ/HisF2 family acetamidino modification protein [unclassified Cupriavidus]MWL88207.1 imidazole glycerol phosphate synthase subunit HisF [Cupriavidus sp. SW-Y-13]
MLRSRIIPCLLMHDGGLVKTRQFKDAKYVGDPLNAVKIFNEKEVDELMFIDIDATVEGKVPNFELLRSLAVESRMPLAYGGGVSSAAQAAKIIALGFEKVSISAAAVERPELIREVAEAIGAQSVVVTLDVRKNKLLGGYTVYTHNGREKHKLNLIDFCQKVAELGAGEITINSIDRDGEMAGYDLALAKQVRSAVTTPLTFVGGAGSTDDMQVLIDSVGVVGAAAGSMFVFKGPYRAVLINYARPAKGA